MFSEFEKELVEIIRVKNPDSTDIEIRAILGSQWISQKNSIILKR